MSCVLVSQFICAFYVFKLARSDEADSYDFSGRSSTPFTWIVAQNVGPAGVPTHTYTRKLGEPCPVDTDCISGYSKCIDGKCACIEGFKSDKSGACRPISFNCPNLNGNPVSVLEPDKIKNCYIMSPSKKYGKWQDSCNDRDQFCFVHKSETTEVGDLIGHCCPKAKRQSGFTSACPLGKSLNFSCKSFSSTEVGLKRAWNPDECQPQTGSYCTKWILELESNQRYTTRPLKKSGFECCSSPCNFCDKYFYMDGFCYLPTPVGKECKRDVQCVEGSCKEDKSTGKKVCSH